MQVLNIISGILVSALLVISTINFISIRRLASNNSLIESKVSILIPMRNEERNVAGCLQSAVSQAGLQDFEILVLDDQSTDETFSLLNSFEKTAKKNLIRVFSGEKLPDGWLGKNFALHTLAKKASGEYLVFLDADVRLDERAISVAIQELEKQEWSYISPYPRQIATGFLANLVQPLLQWSWFSTLILRRAERSLRPATAVANGQFFIVKTNDYRNSGGHAAIKEEVLDDLELARSLRRSKFSGSVVDGSKVAQCQMYTNSAELIAGYEKSQWRAFGNVFGAIAAAIFLFLSSIYPIIILPLDLKTGLGLYLLILLSRFLSAIKTNSVKWTAPLHPLAIAIWIYLIFRSINRKRLNSLYWRGRQI